MYYNVILLSVNKNYLPSTNGPSSYSTSILLSGISYSYEQKRPPLCTCKFQSFGVLRIYTQYTSSALKSTDGMTFYWNPLHGALSASTWNKPRNHNGAKSQRHNLLESCHSKIVEIIRRTESDTKHGVMARLLLAKVYFLAIRRHSHYLLCGYGSWLT